MKNFTQPDTRPIKPTVVRALVQDGDFDAQQWQRYIEQEIGFVLPNGQLQWLINAIDHTAAAHRLTPQQLWYQLPKNDEMRQQLLDKVLIHESRFFRHKPSIDFVTKYALQYQQLRTVKGTINGVADSHSDGLFRIWSVGCASGQETWSLAMSLASEQLENYTILGTDVSQQAIKKSQLGRYHKRQLPLIPQRCQQFIHPLSAKHAIDGSSLFASSTGKAATTNAQVHWEIAPTLQPYVSFALHNIIEQEPPTSHLQNIIICQNMLLYFRKFDQRDILARLAEQCALGGYIILAPGEALFWRPSNMRRIAHQQVNVWQKISA
ncbi:CheR family methyltransferase [Psychrobacter sp. AOP22-C1-22]|uniref:CheR family methyltransferase n=1 Tax=unclassified Psychrobacter TaxID=196806 RepID=UPI0017884D6C|nr:MULTISPECIES: CheR family methyltransferase [unclassified Psychrobacter]MBE0407001.1 chemotaxis protein CheR [Psychrobacter sp. FME6]MBE0445374.1 chemotaxis protein CheR [Psychrobacter sp. FME5]MDN5801033.1 chemotaxis protein CheR [Psychrobacter sp.]